MHTVSRYEGHTPQATLQCTFPISGQEAVAKKYGWDDVFAGKPVGASWQVGWWAWVFCFDI